MLGLGETEDELDHACRDLLSVGVNILTLGQYLRPSIDHLPVHKYIHPDHFVHLAKKYEAMGFNKVFAGPYVRSSYHAGETFEQVSSEILLENQLSAGRAEGEVI